MVSSCSQTSLLLKVVHTFIAEKEMVAESLATILSTFVVTVELPAGHTVAEELLVEHTATEELPVEHTVAEELLIGHSVELEVNRNIELLDLRQYQ